MVQHMPLSVRVPIELDNPSICRNESLCVKCGQCREICTQAIGVHGTYTLSQTGGKAICIHCGQCANVCPTASITEVYEYPDVAAAIKDPEKIVIGGGVAGSFDLFYPALWETFERCLFKATNQTLPIEKTGLGYEAGLMGAAALAFSPYC